MGRLIENVSGDGLNGERRRSRGLELTFLPGDHLEEALFGKMPGFEPSDGELERPVVEDQALSRRPDAERHLERPTVGPGEWRPHVPLCVPSVEFLWNSVIVACPSVLFVTYAWAVCCVDIAPPRRPSRRSYAGALARGKSIGASTGTCAGRCSRRFRASSHGSRGRWLRAARAVRATVALFHPVLDVLGDEVGAEVESQRTMPVRIGTIAVEQLFGEGRLASRSPGGTRSDDSLVVETSLVPVSLRPSLAHAVTRSPYTFLIPAANGQVLLEAEVKPEDLATARENWRARTWAVVWSVLGGTLLLGCGVLMDVRRRAREPRQAVAATAGVLLLLLAARAMAWLATAPFPTLESLELFLTALLLAFAVWLLVDLVERRRVARPRPRLVRESPGALVWTATVYAAAGAAGTSMLWAYEKYLRSFVTQSTLDLTHFSLHPLIPSRLGLAFGLVLLHVAVVWSVVLLLRLAAIEWRRPRSAALLTVAAVSWGGGLALAIVAGRRWSGGNETIPIAPFLVAAAASALLTAVLAQPRGRARRASQTVRLFGLYLALLAPALAMYPSLHAFAIEAKERLIAEELGPQAASQREDLGSLRVPETLEQIDRMPTLVEFVTSSTEDEAPTTRDRAFLVWSQTALAQYRLTSAVELYGLKGRLVSSFALNLPDSPTPYSGGSCDEWDLYEEPPPFGSTKRYVLRASRGICDAGRAVGGIVVRAMFDYRDLPFISAQRRYLSALGPDRQPPVEDDLGRDIEFTVYGWSRAPLYTSVPGSGRCRTALSSV